MIRVTEIRVIDAEGEQLGVMATDQALTLAANVGLDLVEVSPTARPPVCRIMDYGKFKYEENKKQRESKKKQHTQVKEVKFRPKTEEHDYQFKKRHAEEFLAKGHKLKVTLMFRGREMNHKELGARMLNRLEADLVESGFVEQPAKFEGRFMVMYMSPHSARTKQTAKKPEKKPEKKAEIKTSAAEAETDAKTNVEPDAKPAEKEGQDAETKD
jgi:translation initiation factor IF-3